MPIRSSNAQEGAFLQSAMATILWSPRGGQHFSKKKADKLKR